MLDLENTKTGHFDVHCETAEEFMDTLRLTHRLWRGRRSNKWAFRGQGDARWGLVPKAFRPQTNLSYTDQPTHPPLPAERQRREELRALNYFLFNADRVGLPIPGDGQHFRLPDTVQPDTQSFEDWPWPGVLETLAIAQHHGVPTRLLDFSHDPLIAAFFAAQSCATEGFNSSTDMAIWAINLQIVSECVEKHRRRHEKPTVIWVTASRATNTFLHNQDALFLLELNPEGRCPPSSPPPDLRDAILAAPECAGIEPFEEPLIVRILLSTDHTQSLLRLLWNEEYHPARIMPTYDNVVATLEYRRKLGV